MIEKAAKTCTICGYNENPLRIHAHHHGGKIIFLCVSCHSSIHAIGRRLKIKNYCMEHDRRKWKLIMLGLPIKKAFLRPFGKDDLDRILEKEGALR